MSYDFAILMDFISSLALLALLAMGYGAMRRTYSGPICGPVLLGILFGVVTIIQMHTPLNPTEGVIIDMRNVPIALAGAFLGFRGLAVCLTIAVATRYGLGGVGWVSGVLGMMIAGIVGLVWDRYSRHIQQRGPMILIGLGVAMCSHLMAVIILPNDIAVWFITTAAPVIVLLNVVSVPIVGALLERERVLLGQENQLKAAAIADPKTGLLTQAAFAREVSLATAAHPDTPIAAILVARIRNRQWLQNHLGSDVMAQLTGGLRHRLKGFLQPNDFLGQSEDGHILIPMTPQDLKHLPEIELALRRALRDLAISLPKAQSARLVVDCTPCHLNDPLDAHCVAENLREQLRSTASTGEGHGTRPKSLDPATRDLHRALFAKLENLRIALHG